MQQVTKTVWIRGRSKARTMLTFLIAFAATSAYLHCFVLPVEAQQKNAAHGAWDAHGGNALLKNPIAPGPETFDETLQIGNDVGNPGPADGGQDPLGGQSGTTIAGLMIPNVTPPLPPQVPPPLICEDCFGLARGNPLYR